MDLYYLFPVFALSSGERENQRKNHHPEENAY
jgi:hypothetical protein